MLQQLQTDSVAIEGQFGPIHEQYQILEKYEVAVKDEEKMLLETLTPSWQAFQVQIQESEQDLREQKTKFKADILSAVDEFSRTVSIIKEDFNAKGPFNAAFGVENAMISIAEYSGQIETSLKTQASLKKGLNVFKIDQVLNKDMEGLHGQLDSLKQVWQLTEEFDTVFNSWKQLPFLNLSGIEMEETVAKFIKKFSKLPKDAKERDVFQVLKDRVNQTKRSIPLLLELKNPALRDRHWSKLMEEIGKQFDPHSEEFTLEKIFSLALGIIIFLS